MIAAERVSRISPDHPRHQLGTSPSQHGLIRQSPRALVSWLDASYLPTEISNRAILPKTVNTPWDKTLTDGSSRTTTVTNKQISKSGVTLRAQEAEENQGNLLVIFTNSSSIVGTVDGEAIMAGTAINPASSITLSTNE